MFSFFTPATHRLVQLEVVQKLVGLKEVFALLVEHFMYQILQTDDVKLS